MVVVELAVGAAAGVRSRGGSTGTVAGVEVVAGAASTRGATDSRLDGVAGAGSAGATDGSLDEAAAAGGIGATDGPLDAVAGSAGVTDRSMPGADHAGLSP